MNDHPLPAVSTERGTSVELFTGGGGLALAMHKAGFRHLLAVEWDRRACATLRDNVADEYADGAARPTALDSRWPLIEGDVRGVDFTTWRGGVDVIAGGVPCQPWSLGGVSRGFDDDRNLWPELFRCVREIRPRAIVAENVKGLLRPAFKPYYDYILKELSLPFERRVDGEDWRDHERRLAKALATNGHDLTERYDVTFQLVNAADYGVPQHRWRVFVVALRKDLAVAGWQFPRPTHSQSALLSDQTHGGYWERHGLPPQPGHAAYLPSLGEQGGRLPWVTLRDAIQGLPEPLGDRVEHPDWIQHYGWPGAREYPGHTANDLDRPAKTVKAGVHGVPGGETVLRRDDGSIRYMTVREIARVMTFPDRWRLSGPRGEQIRQLGNAVPVDLGAVVANSVAAAIPNRTT